MRYSLLLLVLSTLLLLMSVQPSFSQSVVNGSLTTRIDSLTSTYPSTAGTNEYQPPTSTQLTQWGTVVTEIIQKNYSGANTDAVVLGYHVIQFIDTTTTPRVTYYILEKNSSSTNHWGVYCFNPAARRPKLVIEAPHVLYDLNTEKQARLIFMSNGARAMFIAGTHRCNNSSPTTCSGTTTACSDTAAKYKLSDQCHVVNGTFQKTTDILRSKIPNMFVIQPHGFGKDSGDPDVIMSNGTRSTPATDYLVQLRDNWLAVDGTLTFKLAHIDLTWTKLVATENTQGRLINGSSNPCSNNALSASGRFIHCEQAYSKLRDSENNRRKLSTAISMTFPADTIHVTSPNGGESWQGGSVHSITWTSTGFIDSVMIEYSLDNGTIWKTVVASLANTKTYSWTVPSIGCWRTLVRVSDIANAVTNDVSDAKFTLSFVAWPISGSTTPAPIASAFGPRMLSGVYDFHRGFDMPNALNTPVHPAKAGVIVRMEDTLVTIGTGLERYGNWILVKHESVSGSPRHTGYLHLNGFGRYHVGDTVSTADTIGYVGHSGVGINTTHLHFEYYKNLSGTSIDNTKIFNPLETLPYNDANGYTVKKIYRGDSTAVEVTIPTTELDFDEVIMYGSLTTRTVAFNSRTGIDPSNNDNPYYNNVFIDPDPFTVDSAYKRIRFWTKQSEIGDLDSITIGDIKGYTATFVEYSGQRYAVANGDWDDSIWAASPTGVPGSVPVPSQYDNIQIGKGVSVTVTTTSASCQSVGFQDSTASLALASGSILNVYGDFIIAAPGQKAFSSWAPGAKLRFAGSNQQTLSGWSTTSYTADSTALMEVVVDKTGDTLKTPGTDMKLDLGTSLEIVQGVFMLGYRDDIDGRTPSSSTKPTITIDSAGVFTMAGSLSSIRSGSTGCAPIGKMIVNGIAHLATTSSNGICLSNVDVPSGGELNMESFTTSYKNIILDTVHIFRGGELWNNSTTVFWNDTVSTYNVVYLDTGAVYKVTASTTNFPPVFYNKGTVRYQRTSSDGSQTIVDMNYFRLEISYAGTKTWTLSNDRTIYDSLEINNGVAFVLTASNLHNLNLKGTLRLTSGSLDNSNANVNLTLTNGALISRAFATLAAAPTFGASVNVRYSGTTGSVTTGPELPVSASVLHDLTIICDTTTVALSSPVTINGTLTLSNGIFDNSGHMLTFANAARIRRATGVLTALPVFSGIVELAYISTLGTVTTGFEMPSAINSLDTLSIESPQNITLNSDATVNGTLSLKQGMLYLGDYDLTLGASATVSGNPADSTMVVTTGAGNLNKIVASVPTAFMLAIGDTVGGKHYAPASFNFSSGSFGSNASVGIRVINAKHPSNQGITDYLNRYWIVTPNNLSNIVCGVTFQYNKNDVRGNEGNIVLGQWDGSSWTTYNFADTTHHTLTGSVTNFAEFSGIPYAQVTTVRDGWNLLSVPISALDMTKHSLFPTSASDAFGFSGGYVVAETLHHGAGYWLKFSGDQGIVLTGKPVINDTVPVNHGWNMIGAPSAPVLVGSIVGSGTSISSDVFKFDGGYLFADTLTSGNGYWVKVTNDGELILGSNTLSSKSGRRSITSSKSAINDLNLNKITFQTSSGKIAALYFGNNDQSDSGWFELPPAPPQNTGSAGMDVRFATNRFAELITAGTQKSIPVLVTASPSSYPITVSWEMKEKYLNAAFKIGEKRISLTGGGSVTLPQATQTFLELSDAPELPATMQLSQNYPNPFNPTTKIQYALPVKGRVMVQVYNVFGQLVGTLVNGLQDAGYHTVEWNASGVASGMYFYRLQAGEKIIVNKMLLLK